MIVTYSGKISNPQKRNRHHALTGLISIKYVRYLNSLTPTSFIPKKYRFLVVVRPAGVVVVPHQQTDLDISIYKKKITRGDNTY